MLRIAELEKRVAQLTGPLSDGDQPKELPAGSVVLDFSLPTLSGATMTLSQWRGRRVLLIFFDHGFRFCREMLPELATLEPDPADGHPLPLVVSTGDHADNRRLMDEGGVRCAVLLQERDEVAKLYLASGTPMGYRIGERGATAGPLAVGARALMALARTRTPVGRGGNGHALPPEGNRHTPCLAPTVSRINRNGLPAGASAPPFHLPRSMVGSSLFRLRH